MLPPICLTAMPWTRTATHSDAQWQVRINTSHMPWVQWVAWPSPWQQRQEEVGRWASRPAMNFEAEGKHTDTIWINIIQSANTCTLSFYSAVRWVIQIINSQHVQGYPKQASNLTKHTQVISNDEQLYLQVGITGIRQDKTRKSVKLSEHRGNYAL